jgi:hypothetical protein
MDRPLQTADLSLDPPQTRPDAGSVLLGEGLGLQGAATGPPEAPRNSQKAA